MGFCCTSGSPRMSLVGSHGRSWHHKWLPTLCLRRGQAAGTASHDAGRAEQSISTISDGTDETLETSAGFFPSSLDAPHLRSPVAHTVHSCTVLPHQQPWPCLTSSREHRTIGLDPEHGACTATAAQLAPHGHSSQAHQTPDTSGDSAAVAGMWEATGRGLAACPGHINLTWGELDRERAQPSWNAGYAALVCYAKGLFKKGQCWIRQFAEAGHSSVPSPSCGRGAVEVLTSCVTHRQCLGQQLLRCKDCTQNPWVYKSYILEGFFSSWVAFLSQHPTLAGTDQQCYRDLHFLSPAAGKRKHWATGTFTQKFVILSIIFPRRYSELIFHNFLHTLKY